MSSLGRRKVLHRRRARREKPRKLRRRYLAAATEADQKKILEKVSRVAPTIPLGEFLTQFKKRA